MSWLKDHHHGLKSAQHARFSTQSVSRYGAAKAPAGTSLKPAVDAAQSDDPSAQQLRDMTGRVVGRV